MCCQSQGTKGALFTSRETAQFLPGVRRVLSPATLPENTHRLFAVVPELSMGVSMGSCRPSARQDPALRQKWEGPHPGGGLERGYPALGSRALPECEAPPASERLQPWDSVPAPDRDPSNGLLLSFHSAGTSRVPGVALWASLRTTLAVGAGNRETVNPLMNPLLLCYTKDI